MILRKIARVVRRMKQLEVIHVRDEIWLACGGGIYRASGLPKGTDSETILTILDIPEKQAAEMTCFDTYWDAKDKIIGLDLQDTSENINTEMSEVRVTMFGTTATMLLCMDDEIVFFDEALLTPIEDVFRDREEYVKRVVRVREDGSRYILIYDGMHVIAAILPLELPNAVFCSALREMSDCCLAQMERVKRRSAGEEAST